jgi:hypothetical protein
MFQFEAKLNEQIKIEMWDDDGADWFNEDDLIDTVIFDAVNAAEFNSWDRVHHIKTINIAGGTLDIEVMWDYLSTEELTGFLKNNKYAPEPVGDGCWRPDGMQKCSTFEDSENAARRRLADTCAVENHATTCTCAGLNAHLNFGVDLGLGIGEINLNFDFSYENTNYVQKRYFPGELITFNVWPQTDLVCLDCEGCMATLARNTRNDGWVYNPSINPDTGLEMGWEKREPPISVWVWVGVAAAVAAVVGTMAVVWIKDVGGVKTYVLQTNLEETAVASALQRVGFKAGVGGAGRKSSAIVGGGAVAKRGSTTGAAATSPRRTSGLAMTEVKKHGAPKRVSGTAGASKVNYV